MKANRQMKWIGLAFMASLMGGVHAPAGARRLLEVQDPVSDMVVHDY